MSLSAQDMQTLSTLLDERRRFLEQDIQREVADAKGYKDIGGEVMDPGDSAAADLIVDLGHAEVARDVAELRAIDAARARMESGDYGFCESCGADIPLPRLQVQPAASRCAPCQSTYEKTYAENGKGATL